MKEFVLNLEHIFYIAYRHTHQIRSCPHFNDPAETLCSLPVSISMSLILLNGYVRRETANMLSTNVLLKTVNLDRSWLCLNMMFPSSTNYLWNSSMPISLISLTITSSRFTAFLISLLLFTKFARSAYLTRPNLLLVVWENLMIVYHGAV